MTDLKRIEAQLGRSPRAFSGVAVRCPHGGPAVTEQQPFDCVGEPFPTQFWLSCRHLSARIARIESHGGVERFSLLARDDPELSASLARADAEQRSIRPELAAGIGGGRGGGSLKCLHAHAAFALARPGYALGERILAEAAPLWPDGHCCVP